MMDVSQILPNLFVGSFPKSTEDIDHLRREGITAVLNAQTDDDMDDWGVNWNRLEPYYREVGMEARRAPVRDFDSDDLAASYPDASTFWTICCAKAVPSTSTAIWASIARPAS